MSEEANRSIPPIIAELVTERQKQGLKQTYIAEKIGIGRDYLSKLENGKFICRYEFLERYAEALGFRLGLVKVNQD